MNRPVGISHGLLLFSDSGICPRNAHNLVKKAKKFGGIRVHQLRRPTNKQVKLAQGLGISIEGKSFRVLSAEIADSLEAKSFETVSRESIAPGMKVEYVRQRVDMPTHLEVSSVSKNGFLYLKRTSKYCRPWDIRRT